MPALDDLIASKNTAVPAQPQASALDGLLADGGKPTSGGALDSLLTNRSDVPPPPTSMVQGFTQPFRRAAEIYPGMAKSNLEQLEASVEDLKSPTVGGKALAALEILGSTANYAFTPFEAAARALYGDQFEQITGIKGSSKKIGEWSSFAAQLATDPVMAGTKLGRAIRGGKVGQGVETVLSPTSVGPRSKLTELVVRSWSGKLAAATARASHDLEAFRGMVNRLSEADRFVFMDRIEQGVSQANPELQAAADKMRTLLKDREQKIQSLGKGYLENAVENYFPHLWKDPKKAQSTMEAINEELAHGQSKRPLKGSGNFLKQRTVQTIMQGRARGLTLKSTDPIELTTIKLRELDKFYYGTKMVDTLKAAGLARFMRHPADAPAGWRRLDDPAFRVRSYSEEAAGIVERGFYYAPEEVARVFNNYVSKGLYGENAIFDMVRHAENALNSLQLAIALFHLSFTTQDTMTSKLALGLMQATRGQFGKAAANIGRAFAPTTALETVIKGAKLRQAFFDPGGATPLMRKMVEAVEGAGGRVNMDAFYRSVEGKGLFRAIKNGSFQRAVADNFKDHPWATALTLPFDIAFRAVQDISAPLLEYVVPRQKLGVFYDMAKDWIDHNPQANQVEFLHAMQLAWDSVDNRLGQLVYDNIFWDKTLKDLAFISVRSVGWNLGTIRELGGGIMDLGQAMAHMAEGDKIEMTYRMSYSIAMPIMAAWWGSIMTYLFTGEAPKEIVDYFFPPTGGTTPHGVPERVSIPSYMKDVIEYNRAPVQTVLNKTNPLLSVISEIINNRDFYGGIIQNPNDPVKDQIADLGKFLAESMTPFSFRSAKREKGEGANWGEILASFLGFQAAPGFITDPERTKAFEAKQNKIAIRRRAREQ